VNTELVQKFLRLCNQCLSGVALLLGERRIHRQQAEQELLRQTSRHEEDLRSTMNILIFQVIFHSTKKEMEHGIASFVRMCLLNIGIRKLSGDLGMEDHHQGVSSINILVYAGDITKVIPCHLLVL
jgi:hypothetical protein